MANALDYFCFYTKVKMANFDNSVGLRQALQKAEAAFISKVNKNISNNLDQVSINNQQQLNNITGNYSSNLGTSNLGSGPTRSNDLNFGNSLNGALNRSDPILSFSWYAEMPTLNPTVLNGTRVDSTVNSTINNGILGGTIQKAIEASFANSAVKDSVKSNLTCPWYYVETANCPFRSFATVSRFVEGRKRNYPGAYSVGDLILGMYMDNSNISLAYLKTWENLILAQIDKKNKDVVGGNFGIPINYKKSIFIYLLSAVKKQIMVIEYAECWPTNLHAINLDSASSTRVVANVNFSVGDVYTTIFSIDNSTVSNIINGNLSIKNAISK